MAELVKGELGCGPGLILPSRPPQPQFLSIFYACKSGQAVPGASGRAFESRVGTETLTEDVTSNRDTVQSLGSTARRPQRRPGAGKWGLVGDTVTKHTTDAA